MFKIKSDPTFEASLTIVGQGREQVLNVTFRHKTRTQYAEMLQAMADQKLKTVEAVLDLVEKWDADVDLDKEGVELLLDEQPGIDWAIVTGFGQAITVARKGN